MKDIMQSRIASGLSALAGVWLLLTPLAISMTGVALKSILITGGVVVLASLIQMFWFNTIPSWVNAVTAIWMFISAFALTMTRAASWNLVIMAIVIFALASWDGVEANEVHRQHHAGV